MERCEWDALADYVTSVGKDGLQPARLPDEWLARLYELAWFVTQGRGDDDRHEQAFELVCAAVLRLRGGEWRQRDGGLYVSLRQLWRAVEDYARQLHLERTLRAAEARLRTDACASGSARAVGTAGGVWAGTG